AAAGATRVAVGAAAPTAVIDRRHRRRWIWIVLALAIVAATAVAGVFAWQKWSDRPVSVPSVVGADAGKARHALRDAGFKVRIGAGYSDTYTSGAVMSQLPRAGTDADKGATVALVVSRGPLHLTVANVVGKADGEAADALRAQTFVPRKRRGPSADVAAGRVFEQRPQAGTSLLRGSPVTYWVSTGPPLVRVPDVVGVSQGEATGRLEDAGFDVKAAAAIGFGHTPGDVIRQEPVGGDKAARGSTVTIWIAIL
ncbi:MAG TPA: PASTA domain-containing protein, partial [Thermoleophilia bacterium]|nr:PASTA domain-containing protein [Thermoleophilia bacterium]